MDTYQLRYALLEICSKIKSFVCAKNELKYVNEENFCIIFNTSNNDTKGKHWCALYKSIDIEEIQFFDSFGLPYYYYGSDVVEFLRKKSKVVRYNSRQLQPNSSSTCGMFCLYFIYKRMCGISFDEFLSLFSSNKFKNATLVYNFVSNSFKFPLFSNCCQDQCCDKKCMNSNYSSVCCKTKNQCVKIFNK